MSVNLLKKIIIYCVLIGSFYGGIKYAYNRIEKLKAENERLSDNLINLNMDIEVRETANKELTYSVNALTLKANELQNINKRLYDDAVNMELKIKKLQSMTNIGTKIIQKFDTIPIVPTLDNFKRLSFIYNDKYSEIKGMIDIPDEYIYNAFKTDNEEINTLIVETFRSNNSRFLMDSLSKSNPYIHTMSYSVEADLIVANEYLYKRRWIFWKRKVGVKTHIKSNNPNLNIDSIVTVQFDN